ncbi:response regulator transcription factor [Nitrincola sp. MINF-07-Sa-05]|uniref:response regulator transcription factor n=1 Tax=Nitrincola salilacus TaxID=3400273 RepID=UPI00391859F9
MMGNPIRIILADDHPIVRDALKNILAGHNLVVVAEAESGSEAIELLENTECDLLILDLMMPGHPIGPELIEMIASGSNPPPVLVFSMSDDERTASDALQAGASGYLTKDSEPTVILDAVLKVAAKGKYISPVIAEKILFGERKMPSSEPLHKQLSRREYQIFLMLLDGKTMDTIASELSISRQTVGTHKMRLMHKLDLQNNIDIVRYAINHGLMSL